LFLLASLFALLVAAIVRQMQGPHALAIGMIQAPVVILVVFGLGARCILVWWQIVPPVLFMDWAWCMVLLPVVVHIGVFIVIGIFIFPQIGWFLYYTINLCNFVSQGNNLFLVSIWTCPGCTLDHVCILALGHLHELIGGEVCSTIVNIVMMMLDPHDEQFV